MLEETKKLLKMVEDLEARMSGKAPVQKTQEPKPQETKEEARIAELEKKYQIQLFNRKLEMNAAAETIMKLSTRIEELEGQRAQAKYDSQVYKIVDEIMLLSKRLDEAKDKYTAAEGGEEEKQWNDLTAKYIAGNTVNTGGFTTKKF